MVAEWEGSLGEQNTQGMLHLRCSNTLNIYQQLSPFKVNPPGPASISRPFRPLFRKWAGDK